MQMHMGMEAHVYVHVEVRGQTPLSFSGKPSASLTQTLSLAWSSPIRLDYHFSKSQGPSVSSSSALGSQDSAILLGMFLCVPGTHGSWEFNSGPCDCKASALQAEASCLQDHTPWSLSWRSDNIRGGSGCISNIACKS